jgi:hypothetical protein
VAPVFRHAVNIGPGGRDEVQIRAFTHGSCRPSKFSRGPAEPRYIVGGYLDDDGESQISGPEGRDDPDPQPLLSGSPRCHVEQSAKFGNPIAVPARRGCLAEELVRNPCHIHRRRRVGIASIERDPLPNKSDRDRIGSDIARVAEFMPKKPLYNAVEVLVHLLCLGFAAHHVNE